MMAERWGRLTIDGGEHVEGVLRTYLSQIAAVVESVVPRSQCRAVILLGGYGRGEGGVHVEAGRERPHNNLDILVVTRGLLALDLAGVKRRVDAAIAVVSRDWIVAVDVGVISALRLQMSACSVMWYDMRFGHKILLGEADYVRGFSRFTLDGVNPVDFLNLLVNRGTLLLINEMLLGSDETEDMRRTVVRHGVKAIIGYGDAFLFFAGQYHWSYRVRRARMASQTQLSPEFRELYEGAMQFRFRPDYSFYADTDLRAWNCSLLARLEPVHLKVEAALLKRPGLTWEQYSRFPRRNALAGGWLSYRAKLMRLVGLLRRRGFHAGVLPRKARWHEWCTRREVLSFVFPLVAYGLASNYRRVIDGAVDCDSIDRQGVRDAYLDAWARDGDHNYCRARFGDQLPAVVGDA